ncbi:DUF3102 domain-containing protein [Brevibacillus borstelensis]|uniref:DUF3102 domain-containing protein n=1 Tax=Brevibacillus borstelensis TaxID=45462 RepID=UPI0004F265D9|nr:DUF3102 domain-containing protein [Brevibacillus borstelensis]KKX56358.1 hypothetical protein X546_04550 [Brevibacillus borstelensis cifa_chp40]
MSELVRTAQVIAAEIRSIDAQTREIVLRSAIEIGKRLNEAKALVSHGEWGAWLEANVHYSYSTANNFMRIAEEYKDSQTLGNLSYSQAVALLGVPAEEREQFAAGVGAENLSTRELQQAIKEKKQLEKELKKIQQAAEKDRKAREELAERVSQLQIELADAKIAGDAEQAQKLQEALAEAQAKVKQLEKELRAKPIDVPAVVEKIPEEVEKELAELRKKVAQPGNETAIKFKVQFEALGSGFRDLLATLVEIQSADPDMHEKYRGAVLGLIGKMSETLR